MSECLQIDIAGVGLWVETTQRHLLAPLLQRFGPFARICFGRDSGVGVLVQLCQQMNRERMLSWEFHYEPSAASAFGIASNVLPSRQRIQRRTDGSVCVEAASYQGHWDGRDTIHLTLFTEEVAHSVEGFLLGILPDLLLSRQGCFLHASGLVGQAGAYLFTGPSGSGKTTMVMHSPDKVILSDELVVVRYHPFSPHYGATYVSWEQKAAQPSMIADQNEKAKSYTGTGELWAYGTPFFGSWGKPGVPVAVPVRRIHFLAKALEHRLENLSARECFRRLCGVVCYRQPRTSVVESLLALVDQMIPLCRLLHFYPNPNVWSLVEGVA